MLAATAMAQQPEILTLEQCCQMAIENNTAMKTALDKAEAAKWVSRNALTNYFPNITAGGVTYTTNKGLLQYDFGISLEQIGLGTLGGLLGSMGLPTGFSHDFQLAKKGTLAGVNLVQPIFMGGRIINGNRLAHVGQEVARLESERTRNEVMLQVEEYYWKLATLNAKKQTVAQLMEMLDTLTQYVGTYVDAGVANRNDLLQVKLKRNQMASNMVDLDNGIYLVRMALSQYIGRGPLGNVDVAPAPANHNVPELPLEYYVDPAQAVTNTPAYGLLQQSVKASELQQKIAVGDNLPVVAGGAGYFYEHLFKQDHGFGALYLTVSVPITAWWGGSYNIKRRQVETRMARANMEDKTQLLMINMANAWNDIVSARDKIAIAVESMGQAEDNLNLNRAYYEAGMVTLTDLLQAQALYKNSCDEYVEAYGNFMIKTLQYRQASGQE